MTTMAQARLPDSPSLLADSLANIRLDETIKDHEEDSSVMQGDSTTTFTFKDSTKVEPTPSSPSSESSSPTTSIINATPAAIAENLRKISNGLDSIREQLFIIQEKRHAGIFAIAEDVGSSSFSSSTNTPTKDNKIQKEKNLVLDVEMAKLNALMEGVSNRLQMTERHLENLAYDEKTPTLQRRGSFASLNSLSSLDSFDNAFGVESIGITKKPEILRKQYADLVRSWEDAQKEAKTLEEELSGDKYLRVFNSIGDQMEEMMDSLDKALANCHDFVFAFNRDRAQQAMEGNDGRLPISSSYSSAESDKENKDQPSWRTNEERLAALQTVKRSFNVKRTSYGPACEQMFSSLERGVKQHSTRNGTILRRFMELKTRWRSLRDRVSRMDKELKRIEARLMEFNADTAQDVQSLAVNTPPRRPPSRLSSAAYSPSIIAAANNRNIAHDRSPSLGYSPSANTSLGNLSTSLTHNYSPSASAIQRPPSSASSRADDTKRQSRIPRLMSAGMRMVNAASRRSSVMAEERPGSALSFTSNSTAMLGQSPSSSRIRDTNVGAPGSSPPVSFSQQREYEAALRTSMQTPEPTIMARVQRMSLFGGGVGAGASSSKRSSRPPPVRYSANRVAAAAENQMNRSPSSNSLSAIATSNAAANARNSPQQQKSKPLNISKRNSSLFTNNNGRTTPLSAAALAKVPYATTGLNGEELPSGQYRIVSSTPSNSGMSGLNTGDGASSVSNYRAKRSSMIPISSGSSNAGLSQSYHSGNQSMSASMFSGRETPTFSDGGNSSVWEGTVYGARPSSRLTSGFGGRNSGIIGGVAGRSKNRGFDPYKPNPNDAIDVEVARVVNNLGVRIERVDPPLPKGVKELNPSSSKLVRYQVGTKVIVCKLLQLHRPANIALQNNHSDSDGKAKKVLTRVGGGWIDLEQYLLSRLGTM